MMEHNASSRFVTGSKLRRVTKRYALGFQLLLIVWNPITRDVFRMNCIHLVLESHCIIITPLNTKLRSPWWCQKMLDVQWNVPYASVPSKCLWPWAVEKKVRYMKSKYAGLTWRWQLQLHVPYRCTVRSGQEVRDCRSFGRVGWACAVIRFCIDVISNMQ